MSTDTKSAVAAQRDLPTSHGKPATPPPARLGEELPVFCEKCGYSLHALPQIRCTHCTILQFQCPECGHHQPINTLRPAAQRILGRLRAVALVCSIILRLNFFIWLLFAWFVIGVNWPYHYNYNYSATLPINGPIPPSYVPLTLAEVRWNYYLAFGAFALPFGWVSRLLLLRWRHGYLIGLILGAITVAAMVSGVWFRTAERNYAGPLVLGSGFKVLTSFAFLCIFSSAAASWPIWYALVHMFLPKRTAHALLEWQRSLSAPTALARE